MSVIMESKIKWVIRSKHGQFVGPGKLTRSFLDARKYSDKTKANEDMAILKSNLRLMPFDETFFIEGWEED